MNTLTGIEAERVVQILRYASDRLHMLSYLPTGREDDLLDQIENEIVKGSLDRQFSVEENFMAIRDGLSAAEISLQKQMHKACRASCRYLSADRDALGILMNRPEIQQTENFMKFIRYLNDLNNIMKIRMQTTVEDEASNRTQLHDLTEKERHAEESREALQSKLNEVRDQKEHVTFGLDQILRKLRLELSDLTQQNKLELEVIQKEMLEAISQATSDHELRMRQLQDQVDGLERQMTEATERNREVEIKLRKDKTRKEKDLNTKIQTYDEDMESKRLQLETMNKEYAEESKEFAVLREYFDKLDADLGRENEEKSILNAVTRREGFAKMLLDRACAKIQSIARMKQTRAEYLKSKSKKKGKKKGKK